MLNIPCEKIFQGRTVDVRNPPSRKKEIETWRDVMHHHTCLCDKHIGTKERNKGMKWTNYFTTRRDKNIVNVKVKSKRRKGE